MVNDAAIRGIISRHGQDVTWIKETDTLDTDYGVPTSAIITSQTIKTVIQPISVEKEMLNFAGLIKAGDLKAFFLKDYLAAGRPKINQEITNGTDRYQIVQVKSWPDAANEVYVVCVLRRADRQDG